MLQSRPWFMGHGNATEAKCASHFGSLAQRFRLVAHIAGATNINMVFLSPFPVPLCRARTWGCDLGVILVWYPNCLQGSRFRTTKSTTSPRLWTRQHTLGSQRTLFKLPRGVRSNNFWGVGLGNLMGLLKPQIATCAYPLVGNASSRANS